MARQIFQKKAVLELPFTTSRDGTVTLEQPKSLSARYRFPLAEIIPRSRDVWGKLDWSTRVSSTPAEPVRYGEPNATSNAIEYAKHRSRLDDVLIRVYYDASKVNATHEHAGDFRKPE